MPYGLSSFKRGEKRKSLWFSRSYGVSLFNDFEALARERVKALWRWLKGLASTRGFCRGCADGQSVCWHCPKSRRAVAFSAGGDGVSGGRPSGGDDNAR